MDIDISPYEFYSLGQGINYRINNYGINFFRSGIFVRSVQLASKEITLYLPRSIGPIALYRV
jgi:hypothetical protein